MIFGWKVLRFLQNLCQILVILQEREWTDWSQDAYFARKGSVFSPNPLTTNFEQILNNKFTDTKSESDDTLQEVVVENSLAQDPTVVNGVPN